ncbi:MAG: hypothetical protein KJ950_06425 [Proteobacteria bacterium]|nr:hypothetical protein [Pseudomonadota bacterium]MBU1687168.1 hypothetical protein [Pseudomonadota bacterium]
MKFDGVDVINDWSGGRGDSTDQIFFDNTVDPSGVTVTMSGANLVISYGTSDQLTTENWTNPDYRIEAFHFAWDSSTFNDLEMDGLIVA